MKCVSYCQFILQSVVVGGMPDDIVDGTFVSIVSDMYVMSYDEYYKVPRVWEKNIDKLLY